MTPWIVMFAVLAALVSVQLYFWRDSDRAANACAPHEVLAALVWEIPGKNEGTRFEGRHKDRGVVIDAHGGEYRIEIEGVPAGDLEGGEVLARIEALARDESLLTDLPDAPDWQAILRVFHAHPIRFANGKLLAKAAYGGGVIGPLEEAKRLKRLLDRLVEVTRIAQVALSLRARDAQDTRCPYCHDGLVDKEQAVSCPKCGALHHVECLSEHGQCAVFACSARAPLGLRDLSGPGKAPSGSIHSV